MTQNTTYSYIYSPNFDTKKRKKKAIKFLIFHYTGMKSELAAIKKLTSPLSKVSCHYFIKSNGKIIQIVPDAYVAWHAGLSCWKSYRKLNKHSIGIEIHNPGHEFGYKFFTKKQISSIIFLSKKLIKKHKISKKHILGHSDISPDRKKDPGEKFPWKAIYEKKIGMWHSLKKSNLTKIRTKTILQKEKDHFIRLLRKIGYRAKNKSNSIKAFQRRFRPELVNGIIDLECFKIILNLTPKLK